MMDNDSNDSEEVVIETLRSRGWCFGDTEPVKGVIMISLALADDPSMVVDSVASELINMDLKSFGGNSLPEPHILRKSSYILGPKVLQVSSVRDIAHTSLNCQSSDHRLLRLGLTDGHSEITAIEYHHVPTITDNVIPGTKVCLVNKAIIRSGIVCLNPNVISVLGGIVQTLFEEWQMNQKFSGTTSRLPMRLSQGGNAGGPPPFEKLQIERQSHQFATKDYAQFALKNSRPTTAVRPSVEIKINPSDRKESTSRAEIIDLNKSSLTEKTEEKPSSSRPKEVVEAVPVQNQAASQKLLQRMNGQNGDNRPSRGRRQRGRGKIEDPVVFTLDEYEKRKAGGNHLLPEASHDEALAWQLQNQFDSGDSQVPSSGHMSQAENIRMSMFSYERDDDEQHHMDHSRRRGGGRTGKGKGGRKGRGRGRSG